MHGAAVPEGVQSDLPFLQGVASPRRGSHRQFRLVADDVAHNRLGHCGFFEPGRGVVAQAVERQLADGAFNGMPFSAVLSFGCASTNSALTSKAWN